jgi:hypothetical protein
MVEDAVLQEGQLFSQTRIFFIASPIHWIIDDVLPNIVQFFFIADDVFIIIPLAKFAALCTVRFINQFRGLKNALEFPSNNIQWLSLLHLIAFHHSRSFPTRNDDPARKSSQNIPQAGNNRTT